MDWPPASGKWPVTNKTRVQQYASSLCQIRERKCAKNRVSKSSGPVIGPVSPGEAEARSANAKVHERFISGSLNSVGAISSSSAGLCICGFILGPSAIEAYSTVRDEGGQSQGSIKSSG